MAHRDINLENVLAEFSEEGTGMEHVKLILMDFGLLQRIPRNPYTNGPCLFGNTRIGKEYYFSYEAFSGRPDAISAFAQDIWALGVILYILVTRSAPFNGAVDKVEWYNACGNRRLHQKDIYFTNVDIEGDGKNSTFETLIDAQGSRVFDANFIDLLAQLLNPISSQRITIDNVLQHPWLQRFVDPFPPLP